MNEKISTRESIDQRLFVIGQAYSYFDRPKPNTADGVAKRIPTDQKERPALACTGLFLPFVARDEPRRSASPVDALAFAVELAIARFSASVETIIGAVTPLIET